MLRNSDFVPKTYSIKGYTSTGPGFGKACLKLLYWTILFALVSVVILFIVYTV